MQHGSLRALPHGWQVSLFGLHVVPLVEQLASGATQVFVVGAVSQHAPVPVQGAGPVEQHGCPVAPQASQVPVTQVLPVVHAAPLVQHGSAVPPHAVHVPDTHTAVAEVHAVPVVQHGSVVAPHAVQVPEAHTAVAEVQAVPVVQHGPPVAPHTSP